MKFFDQQTGGLNDRLIKAQDEAVQLREQVRSESDKRAAAEEKNNRIPELESTIRAKDVMINGMQAQHTENQKKIENLNTTLEKERKSTERKAYAAK